MRRWRGPLGPALIILGALAGSLFDTEAASVPVRAGGYYVIAADFHVHAFPGDGALPRWELAREASRRGLHAIVISNHNQTLAPRFGGAALQGPRSVLMIPSQEITTPRFHLVAAGIRRTIDWRKSGIDIVRDVHAQGGVVIAAHPVGRYWRADDATVRALDGAEVAHPLTSMLGTGRRELTAFFTRARGVNPDIAPIGSSDFHMVAPLGTCRTYVFAETVTVGAVLDAIRAGRTVAEDQDGVLYGAPELTHLMDGTGATERPAPPRRRATLAALMVLAGFTLLVIQPSRRRSLPAA